MGKRTFTILFALSMSVILLALSLLGSLQSAESLAQSPLNLVQGLFGEPASDMSVLADDLAEFRSLQARNQELERALSAYQSELAELRAYRQDYDRLAGLLNYVGQVGTTWRYVTADVIGRDITGVVRTVHINAGTRDGVQVGDPVVVELGLVGRVTQVSATGAEVLLITDQNSSVNARVLNAAQDTGLLRGSISGELVLDFVDVNARLEANQQVFTTGETQSFPPNILLGQVSSVRFSPDELFRQATVQTLVDFDSLQYVLVITNWEPVDLDSFTEPVETTP